MHRFFSLLRIYFDEQLSDGLQVVKYLPGQAYVGHKDYFQPEHHPWLNLNPEVDKLTCRLEAQIGWSQGFSI